MSAWTIIPLQRSLGEFAAPWDRLNQELFDDHPLASSLFVEGLLRQFGEGSEHLCIFTEHDQIRAMCVLKRRNALVWHSFLPSQAQLGATLISDPKSLPSLVSSLPGYAVQLDLMCNDPAFGAVLHHSPRRHNLNHALTMNISLHGTFDAYWSARPKQLQKNMKQRDKRLADDKIIPRLVKIVNSVDVLDAVDRFAALECAGWKGENGTAVGSTPDQHQFYRDLMLGEAHQGNAIIFELWFDSRLAASRLIIRRNKMWAILKTTYDEGVGEFSPGRMLLRSVIDDAFITEPGGMIEFYTDADLNQLAWATSQRWIQHTTIHRHAAAEVLAFGMRAFRRSAPDSHGLSVSVYAHPCELPDDVQRCLSKAEKRNASFGFVWYRNLVDTVYPSDTAIRIYVLRNEHTVLAVVPLRTESMRSRRLSALANFYTSLYEPYFDAGLKSAVLVPLLAAIERDHSRVSSLTLSPMDPTSHAYQVLIEAMQITGWVQFEYFAFGNWYQSVTTSWEQYFSDRPSSLQNTIRRTSKKFEANAGKLEVISASKDLPRAIAAYNKVYGLSWKRPEPFPAFMPGLMESCAANGTLRVGLAWLNGEPIAAQVWIVAHGRAEIYKLAYDERFKSFSSGTLLSALLMEHVIKVDKVSEIDYLIGDDPYKKTWMSKRRERWGLIAYNPRTLHGLAGLTKESASRSIKSLLARFNKKKSTMAVIPSQT